MENANKISNYLIKVIINGNAGLFRPFFLFVILFQLSGCTEKGFAGLDHTDPPENNTPDAVFTAQGTQLISPEGQPIKLCGWRTGADWSPESQLTQADFEYWDSQGLLGNAQAVEIYWTRGTPLHVSERWPQKQGVYQSENVQRMLGAMHAMAGAGSWIIPSIRVSLNADKATQYTRTGTTGWEGWAHHKKLIYNEPVVVETGPDAGTYGNHRDRFFAWLDWLIPQILADGEISSHIAYWEIWHFYGHSHINDLTDADHDQYFDDFIPRLIDKFREYDPDRLLGISVRNKFVMNRLLARIDAGTWTPWDDKNWILVSGGYGYHNLLMRVGEYSKYTWPENSGADDAPVYNSQTGEFDVQKYMRLTGRAVHSQEGPGLWYTNRQNPIPEPQRSFLTGLIDLYNEQTNGFTFHGWPPSQSDAIDQTDLFNILREAFKPLPVNVNK